jgi:hypothetical protein
MEILGIAILMLLFIAVAVINVYVKGMDFFRDNHPDSKSIDLFDEEDKDSI